MRAGLALAEGRQLVGLARAIHAELVAEATAVESGDIEDAGIRLRARQFAPLCTDAEIELLVEMVRDQLFGLGPLDPLLDDDSITEVMVNGPGFAWVERGGRLEASEVELDAAQIRLLIDRIVGPLGIRLDRLMPFADARLPDGSRVHVAIAPMALDGPYLTIRRFAPTTLPLACFGDESVQRALAAAVAERRNVLVSGGTGAGKTSLLNALGSYFDAAERVVTIEDTAELRLPGSHTVRLEARPPTAEGLGEITIRTLVRNALRMRPDRLVVGEVRGGEAFDMVQAMNTGHEGCLATCHANSPSDALDRVVAMVMAGGAAVPVSVIDRQVHSAFDLVVHLERGDNGQRCVAEILEVAEVFEVGRSDG